jgi:ABC-type antimicrobial peptide transport system permease subunit
MTLDPALPFVEVTTLADEVAASTAEERVTATLASMFGALAALLTAAGIYGLLAYIVAHRRREIGIRVALGARPADIGLLVVRQIPSIVFVGVVLGLGIHVQNHVHYNKKV